MTKLSDLINLEKLADLNAIKELIDFVNKAREAFNDLSTTEALAVIRDYLNNTLTGDRKDVLDEVVKTLKLTDKLAALRADWNEIPEQIRSLVVPLNQVGQIKFPLFQKKLSTQNIEGPWGATLGYKVDTSFELEVEGLNSGATELTQMDITPAADNSILNIALSGSLALEGSGSVSASSGAVSASLGGSAGASGGAEVNYYFRNKSEELVGLALADDLRSLVSPFSVAAIAKAGTYKLAAVRFMADSNLNLSVNASASGIYGNSWNVKNDKLELDTNVQLGAGLSLGYNADLKLEGGFDLKLVPANDGKTVTISLSRSRSNEKTSTFNVDANVGITGLDVVGNAIIKEYIPDPAGLLTELNEWLNLGTKLKEMLTARLNSSLSTVPENMRSVLVGTVTGDNTADNLATTVSNELMTLADSQIDALSGDALKKGTELADDLADNLGLPEELKEEFSEKIGELLGKELDKLKGDLETKLAELIQDKGKDELKKLFSPVQDVGENVNELIDKANNLSQDILAPVIAFIEKYQDYRNKLIRVVQGAAKLKLSLSFARTLQKTKKSNVALKFVVDAQSETAGEYVRQMLLGSFQDALTAVREKKAGITLVSGSFMKEMSRNVQSDLNIDLAGFPAATQTILNETVNATWDLAGNVTAFTGTSSFQKMNKMWGETRSLKFANLLELAKADERNTDTVLASSLTLSVTDPVIHAKELAGALNSLGGLIASGATDRALARRQSLDNKSEVLGGTYGANMVLSMEDLQRFVDRTTKDIINAAIDNQVETRVSDPALFQRALNNMFKGTRNDQIKIIATHFPTIQAVQKKFKNRRDIIGYARMAWDISNNAHNLVRIRDIIRDMLALDPSSDVVEAVQKQLQNYNKYLKGWLKGGAAIAFFGGDSFSKKTVAFIKTIHELTSLDASAPALIPTIQWDVDGVKQDDLIV